MGKIRILAVEDAPLVQERYRLLFEEVHADLFTWRLAPTGNQAISLLRRKPFDLILLDIRLPDISGLEILRWREKNPTVGLIPALVVSGEIAPTDRLRGLRAGADDYLPKPFSNEELLARLLALKRRQDRLLIGHGFYDLGWLKFDPDSQEVTQDGVPVHLEPKELDLLVYFLRRPCTVHRSSALWGLFWDDEENPRFEHVLENKISSLRRKLGRNGACLKNHKGIGYSFDPRPVATPA